MCHPQTCRSYGKPPKVVFQQVKLGEGHVVNTDRQPKRQHRWVKVVGIKHRHRTLRWAAGFKLGKAAVEDLHVL
jgi:hypothetical protein